MEEVSIMGVSAVPSVKQFKLEFLNSKFCIKGNLIIKKE